LSFILIFIIDVVLNKQEIRN